MAGNHQWRSASYVHDWVERDVTRDDERPPLLRWVARLIRAEQGELSHVLDVGGGYGPMTAEVPDQRSSAHVVLHDYSEAMIMKARERLARFGNRVSHAVADMTDPGWTASLGGPFGAVVSALAIRNLNGVETVQRVYPDIFALLRPGGCLFNLDLLFSEAQNSPLSAVGTRTGISTSFQPGSRPTALAARCSFSEVDCAWTDLEQGLLWGYRLADTPRHGHRRDYCPKDRSQTKSLKRRRNR